MLVEPQTKKGLDNLMKDQETFFKINSAIRNLTVKDKKKVFSFTLNLVKEREQEELNTALHKDRITLKQYNWLKKKLKSTDNNPDFVLAILRVINDIGNKKKSGKWSCKMVTNDEKALEIKDKLLKLFKITVIHPDELLEKFENKCDCKDCQEEVGKSKDYIG